MQDGENVTGIRGFTAELIEAIRVTGYEHTEQDGIDDAVPTPPRTRRSTRQLTASRSVAPPNQTQRTTRAASKAQAGTEDVPARSTRSRSRLPPPSQAKADAVSKVQGDTGKPDGKGGQEGDDADGHIAGGISGEGDSAVVIQAPVKAVQKMRRSGPVAEIPPTEDGESDPDSDPDTETEKASPVETEKASAIEQEKDVEENTKVDEV